MYGIARVRESSYLCNQKNETQVNLLRKRNVAKATTKTVFVETKGLDS